MLAFAIGIAVAFLWLVLWTLVLHAAGISVFGRSPEQREMRRQRELRMGQARYVIVEGILGWGVAFGLILSVSDYIGRPSDGWVRAASKCVFLAVMFGLYSGFDGWTKLRKAVPFPPESVREK